MPFRDIPEDELLALQQKELSARLEALVKAGMPESLVVELTRDPRESSRSVTTPPRRVASLSPPFSS